jgi:hypothetical protein
MKVILKCHAVIRRPAAEWEIVFKSWQTILQEFLDDPSLKSRNLQAISTAHTRFSLSRTASKKQIPISSAKGGEPNPQPHPHRPSGAGAAKLGDPPNQWRTGRDPPPDNVEMAVSSALSISTTTITHDSTRKAQTKVNFVIPGGHNGNSNVGGGKLCG